MSDENVHNELPQTDNIDSENDSLSGLSQGDPPQNEFINDENINLENMLQSGSTELQQRRTEALERILLASDSNLSLQPSSASAVGRIGLGNARRLGLRTQQQQQSLFSRRLFSRDDLERAIFIPLRTRSTVNLPSSHDTSSRTIRNLMESRGGGDNNGNSHRVNLGTFFMELTYSTEPRRFHLFKNSTETQRRRMEIHAANTMSLIKKYCPNRHNKLNQFRCWIKTQSCDLLDFTNLDVKPLNLCHTMSYCRTKVIVIARTCAGNNWGNPCTSYLLSYLSKKHLSATCISFQSDIALSTLIEQLKDLRVLSEKVNLHDSFSSRRTKRFLVMSTLNKLLENWNIPVIVLDSCPYGIIDIKSIIEFAKMFQIKILNLESEGGSGKQMKAIAKHVGKQVRKTILESNLEKVKAFMKQKCIIATNANSKEPCGSRLVNCTKNNMAPTLVSDDCRRIVYNLQERMSALNHQSIHLKNVEDLLKDTSRISLLEDSILADIENSEAFKCSTGSQTPKSNLSNSGRHNSSTGMTGRKGSYRGNGETQKIIVYRTTAERNESRNLKSVRRPRTGYSQSDEDIRFPSAPLTGLANDQEKVSELLFNELNQRWRVHGPQRFIPSTPDAGPYCEGLLESEKQLLFSVLQEVTNFEMLKDIRNELKDSKKDLEGRLYGYNPEFSNLIASAEEFLHGKASCMEPCKEEMEFYKMPVSLVYSEAELKYMRAKPPVYVIAAESPTQAIKTAMEESTKLFMNAVLHASCGTCHVPSSRRNKTKVIVVIEENNEVLELLTVALWFFAKTPLATFQTKYCPNSEEFQLSLDACRFYFGTYAANSSKKDEHLFERWLGVGMNGILRSYQSKILLIDHPRPGMHILRSKNILYNRLKIEQTLHNIKSIAVGKPSRKEDNLSTVENVLDEIQKCLEPRDMLLFRKARRMYMDLKLYKQIEQKSRQDVKSLRGWGLPEPDNEHEMWEKLRNSEVVVNNVLTPSPSKDILKGTHEISTTTKSSESLTFVVATSEEDIVDTVSNNRESLTSTNNSEENSSSNDLTAETSQITMTKDSATNSCAEDYLDEYLPYNLILTQTDDKIQPILSPRFKSKYNSCTDEDIKSHPVKSLVKHSSMSCDDSVCYKHNNNEMAIEKLEGKVEATENETDGYPTLEPKANKSLQEMCVAHFVKWGKSFSKIIKIHRPRRVFPEGLRRKRNNQQWTYSKWMNIVMKYFKKKPNKVLNKTREN